MLVKLTLADIANICDGELIGQNRDVTLVVTDTRKVTQGCVFVALQGERFDGHDYAVAAMSSGAVGVVVEHGVDVSCVVKVADTRVAYGCIARFIRNAFQGPVICITGSNGKTTVKDWLAQSIDNKNVLKTRANLNNQIGVPQTLLELEQDHQVAVIEAGTNFPGEIAQLAKIAFPDVVVLTNASGSHFEGLGSLEGIAKEKGCLISGAAPNAKVVLNEDDGFIDYWRDLAGQRQVYSFGFTESADLYAFDIELGAESSRVKLRYRDDIVSALIAGAGKHQVANGMAVVLAMLAIGVEFNLAVSKLASPVFVAGRLERFKAKSGALLINDCYNANPTSVKAAIDVLIMQPMVQTWLVLGGLGELGDQQDQFHTELGIYAMDKGVSGLVCLGPIARLAGEAFKERGGRAVFCSSHEEAAAAVQALDEKYAILVKGSRSAKMENVIEILKK